MTDTARLFVYTDGSCRGNPGPGGWAWAIPHGAFASGAAVHTTNQRMEVQAVLEALLALAGTAEATGGITIVSDSTYVIKCFQDRWYDGWIRRGWKNSQRQSVANRDLWEQLFEVALHGGHDISWQWVKGHSGDRWNDVVDQLATEAAALGHGTSSPHPTPL